MGFGFALLMFSQAVAVEPPSALRCWSLRNLPARLRVLHRAELRACADVARIRT